MKILYSKIQNNKPIMVAYYLLFMIFCQMFITDWLELEKVLYMEKVLALVLIMAALLYCILLCFFKVKAIILQEELEICFLRWIVFSIIGFIVMMIMYIYVL